MTCTQLVPTGTVWDMSPERRPRIPEDISARIDAARGRVPFERYVRDLLMEALPPAGTTRETSVESYLATLRRDLDDGLAIDFVASLEEWGMFKQALAMWTDEKDREWDDIARNQEHGTEEW